MAVVALAYIDHHTVLLTNSRVVALVQNKPKAAHLLHDRLPQLHALLANTARKDDGIDLATQLQVIPSDEVVQPVDEQIIRELPLRLVLARRAGRDLVRVRLHVLHDLAKIGRARDRLPAALLVEDLLGESDMDIHRLVLVVAHAPRAVRVVEDERGVDATGACGAGKACQGCEAHGRVEGLSLLDCAHRGSGTEVQHDQVQCILILRWDA